MNSFAQSCHLFIMFSRTNHEGILWFLIIKPTRCTNFSNLFLEWNSTCFGQFLCPSSGVLHCTHSNGICHTGLLTASCQQAVSKPVWHIPLLCAQWKTPDDGQKNCPKHVEFHSKNKFEKLTQVCWQLSSRFGMFYPDPARKLSVNLYDICHCCVYSEKLLMMDRGTVRNM